MNEAEYIVSDLAEIFRILKADYPQDELVTIGLFIAYQASWKLKQGDRLSKEAYLDN